MLTCDQVRDLLALLHYEALEGPERRRVLDHLAGCAACASRFEQTRKTLLSVTADGAFPRENEVDWPAFAHDTARKAREAARLRPVPAAPAVSVPGAAAPRHRRAVLYGGLAAAAVAAVLAALPFWRQAVLSPGAGGAPASPAVAERPTPPEVDSQASEAAHFLEAGLARRVAERSLREGRAVLLDLMETPVRCRRGDGRIDVALEKERARDLLRRLGVQSQALLEPGDRRLAELLGALQEMLLDVSALDDCTASAQLRALREAIERRQLLLRIDLMVSEAEEGGRRA
ncbi:MAG TPA: zf-HC2 domain-containing protein [Candidatus Polarisedimenticolia bacterium]|nr:zf-HC2 domain-containing protein [Candidatus Polarisedimenticolia bacterium]